jgi:hypothetical protein
MRNGHTLLELCAVLLLASLTLSVVVPGGRRFSDAFAVLAAREALAGVIADVRAAAPVHGGGSVHLRSGPWRAWGEAGGAPLGEVALGADLGVSVELSRGRTALELRYDVLGLGQVASETIVLRRGDSRRVLVVSGYGRVRRQ